MTRPIKPADAPTDLVAPTRGSPKEVFSSEAQTFVDRQVDELVPAMNNASQYTNDSMDYMEQTLIPQAEQAVTDAAEQATLAAEQVTLAATHANNASAVANYAGLWSSLTGILSFPSSVYHNNTYWANTVEISDVTASEPSLSNADYTKIAKANPSDYDLVSYSSTLTYTDGDLTSITEGDYQADYTYTNGELTTESIYIGGTLVRTTTFNYTDGVLTSTTVV